MVRDHVSFVPSFRDLGPQGRSKIVTFNGFSLGHELFFSLQPLSAQDGFRKTFHR